MSTDHNRRLDNVAKLIQPKCRTCWGAASLIVYVPLGEDETAPEWNPTTCRECGIPLRAVRKIIGISEDELLGPGDADAST
jgi:hypothetical protein